MNIPETLKQHDRWLRWRPLKRKNKVAKVPTRVDGRNARVNDPSTWTTFAEAAESTVGKGLGFVLGEGVGCVDLDDALDVAGRIESWAADILDLAPETFVEVSQSGRGLHIWGLLAEAPGRNMRGQGMTAEVYSGGAGSGRFIAFGEREWEGSVPELADITDLAEVVTA